MKIHQIQNSFYCTNQNKSFKRAPKSDIKVPWCENSEEIEYPKAIADAKSFLGNKIKISEIRGKWYKLFDNIDTTVIFHPSYLLRNHSELDGSPRWLTKQDLYKIKEISEQ